MKARTPNAHRQCWEKSLVKWFRIKSTKT